jgi:hypothetical protein
MLIQIKYHLLKANGLNDPMGFFRKYWLSF